MTLNDLKLLFIKAGATKLYAKPLAANDNSKNQIYFAGAVETLNVFPINEVYAVNTSKGPSFKATMDFGWLTETGDRCPAPHAQLILYAQYPEVRFSGFLQGCSNGPTVLMADRQRAGCFPMELRRQLEGRILFLATTKDDKMIGYVAGGNSEVALEFNSLEFRTAFVVFKEVPLPSIPSTENAKQNLLSELRRINSKGWIDSKQLDSHGAIRPCNASQCGGFTLEAELGIPKNSQATPDYLGWEIKQHQVTNFNRPATGGAITLMTPEPTGGYYVDKGVDRFVRKYGYVDRVGRLDRMNFGGVYRSGQTHALTGLKIALVGYDQVSHKILDSCGSIILTNQKEEIAAQWSFEALLTHWARKHSRAAYVPSKCKKTPARQYQYGNVIRLALGTNSLLFLKAIANGSVFYDPGIKLEEISTNHPHIKRRSQFRVKSKDINSLYNTVDIVDLLEP